MSTICIPLFAKGTEQYSIPQNTAVSSSEAAVFMLSFLGGNFENNHITFRPGLERKAWFFFSFRPQLLNQNDYKEL